MSPRRFTTLVAGLALCASAAGAQRRPHGTERQEQGQRREQLERQFRARSEQLIRERIRPSEDQMRKLRDVNARLSARRNDLMRQERATHGALRAELARGSSADQSRVAQLMSQDRALQQQRFQLQQDEQRELSTFLTPVQQAQYMGLQAQLRERMRQMRQRPDRE